MRKYITVCPDKNTTYRISTDNIVATAEDNTYIYLYLKNDDEPMLFHKNSVPTDYLYQIWED